MTPFDVDRLATELRRVCTAGLGRPLRKGPDIEQLLQVAAALVHDDSVPDVTMLEEAIVPSIERLGKGELGRLAQIEFGTHPDTSTRRFLVKRREYAQDKLEIGKDALSRLELAMCQALAKDLLVRRATKDGADE